MHIFNSILLLLTLLIWLVAGIVECKEVETEGVLSHHTVGASTALQLKEAKRWRLRVGVSSVFGILLPLAVLVFIVLHLIE